MELPSDPRLLAHFHDRRSFDASSGHDGRKNRTITTSLIHPCCGTPDASLLASCGDEEKWSGKLPPPFSRKEDRAPAFAGDAIPQLHCEETQRPGGSGSPRTLTRMNRFVTKTSKSRVQVGRGQALILRSLTNRRISWCPGLFRAQAGVSSLPMEPLLNCTSRLSKTGLTAPTHLRRSRCLSRLDFKGQIICRG